MIGSGWRSRLRPWRQRARSSSVESASSRSSRRGSTKRGPGGEEGKVGFAEKASFSKMLIGIDVNDGQDAGQPGGKLAAAA
jgi:hypothetical protein